MFCELDQFSDEAPNYAEWYVAMKPLIPGVRYKMTGVAAQTRILEPGKLCTSQCYIILLFYIYLLPKVLVKNADMDANFFLPLLILHVKKKKKNAHARIRPN